MWGATLRWIGILGLAVGIACGAGAPEAYPARGTVTAVDAGARKVTIDHEEIAGLMEAMTMSFAVAPGVALEGLEPGTAVDFEVVYAAGDYTVTKLVRAGPSAPR